MKTKYLKYSGYYIWCSCCKKWIDVFTDIYLSDGSENEGTIRCLKCDAILGYTWDKEWQEIFQDRRRKR